MQEYECPIITASWKDFPRCDLSNIMATVTSQFSPVCFALCKLELVLRALNIQLIEQPAETLWEGS